MNMSSIARLNMEHREKKVMAYYDDMGPGSGNCTWGIGIKAHNGPCSPLELARKVTDAQIGSEFSSRISQAESAVARNVTAVLTQAQFDALVSYTYNRGATGAKPVYRCLNANRFQDAAKMIASDTYGHVKKNGKVAKVLLRGLIPRRIEESSPFRSEK